MRSAFALRIISGNIIYNRAMPERLRMLRHCIFTGRSWERTLSVIAVRCQLPRRGNFFAAAGRFLIAPNTLATNVTAWLSLRGKTSPAPGEDVAQRQKGESGAGAPERVHPIKKRPALPVEMRGAAWFLLKFADHSSILPKLKSAKSSTRSVRLGATGAALSASRGA